MYRHVYDDIYHDDISYCEAYLSLCHNTITLTTDDTQYIADHMASF